MMLLELMMTMEDNKLKILITTSGLGTRLGDMTKFTNKSLIKLGDTAIISHIIESYPDNAEFIITLGYYGEYVKQYLTLAYPNKYIEYVYVDPYEGKGSGLLKSMSFAKERLKCPFIFHACDTIIENVNYLNIDLNWMACVKSTQSDIFRTVCVNNEGQITKINEKGEINYDYAYIGVAGIYDYELFWKILDSILSNNDMIDSSDCHVFMNMLRKTKIYYHEILDWNDVGSVKNLNEARKKYTQKYEVLDKPEECIYFVNNSAIKFFKDSQICLNRVERSKILNGLIPKLINYTSNFYNYEMSDGELLSNYIFEDRIIQLIEWSENNLWKPVNIDKNIFFNKCYDFYFIKTKKRIDNFLNITSISDKYDIINNIEVPDCETMLNMIDWIEFCSDNPVIFHGDFIPDNILYKNDDFILLDWRQDFAGEIVAGDKYYDLSKLNHNLILNHHMLLKKNYTISITEKGIYCDVLISHNMMLCQQKLIKLLEKRKLNIKKIKILTAIIWLNMAPLHTYPLNIFLFYFGKYNLWKEIKEI